MASNKFVRFAAPYRSKTFNDKDNLLVGRNGVLVGGDITASVGSITIDPVVIIQKGLITKISHSLSVNTPINMEAPYFVAISISSAIENPSETITPIFVKRPQDINEEVTLIAEFDGVEWRNLPHLQIDEHISEAARLNALSRFVGVTSGLDVASDVATLTVGTGTLIGADGHEISKTEESVFNKIDAPTLISTQYDRIDSIVFRKPMDSRDRVGYFKQTVGPSFVSGSSTVVEAANNFGSASVTQIETKKSLIDNKIFTAYLEGSDLKMRIIDDIFGTVSSFTVTTGVDYHQFAPNWDGSIDFVYIKGTDLFYIRLDNTGAVVYLETLLLTSSDVLHHCNIACVGTTSNYQMHIAACREVGGTEREIGYCRIGSDGLTLTPYTTWIDLNANLQRPCFETDNEDSLLYVGFDNVDTGRAYLRTYDAFTATPSAPPTQIGTSVELQTEVYNKDTDTLMPNTGASHVRILRGDTKNDVYAFWYHFKGSGVYGVAVYNVNFKSQFGYKAYILDDVDLDQYAVMIDEMNRAYITGVTVGGGSVIKNVFDLNSLDRVGTSDTIATEAGITETNVLFCPRGELLHTYGVAAAGRWRVSTAAVETAMRDVIITPADVLIAHNRKSDDALYVSDTIIGEEPSVRRMYELFNSFGAAGTLSWNIAGANKLVTSVITIRFLNRKATYTIPATGAGGITIASGYVACVEIPDEDTDGTLTLKIVKFGDGFVDRYGKRTLPLFWNISGRLYSNFSPYSFDPGGETATIGATVSDEMLAWLGAEDSAPDSTDHNYNSTNYIAESDAINSAIGKLDSAAAGIQTNLNQDRTSKLVRGGTWSWNSGTGALINSADAYIQVPGLNEVRNTILAQTISLTADGQVAYVSINRTGAVAANLTVTVAAIASVPLATNIVIIARRVGTDVFVGEHSMKLVNGESRALEKSLSDQIKLLLGGSATPITEASSDPLWSTRGSPLRNILAAYSSLDAIASLDNQLSKFFGRLRITQMVDVSKIAISAANVSLLSGVNFTKEINGKLVNFTGATINFQTGVVLKDDDTTALGDNFTPSIPVGEYRWYGIGLITNAVNGTNEYNAKISVTAGATSNAVAASAPLPDIPGDIRIGAVLVQNIAGTYTVTLIRQLFDQQPAAVSTAPTLKIAIRTTSTSWTPPADVNTVIVIGAGGGGGGGSGASDSGSSGIAGGGGGGAGCVPEAVFESVSPGVPVSITIGAGGAGGAGVGPGNTHGNDGNVGGATFFGNRVFGGAVGGEKGYRITATSSREIINRNLGTSIPGTSSNGGAGGYAGTRAGVFSWGGNGGKSSNGGGQTNGQGTAYQTAVASAGSYGGGPSSGPGGGGGAGFGAGGNGGNGTAGGIGYAGGGSAAAGSAGGGGGGGGGNTTPAGGNGGSGAVYIIYFSQFTSS